LHVKIVNHASVIHIHFLGEFHIHLLVKNTMGKYCWQNRWNGMQQAYVYVCICITTFISTDS